MMSFIPLCLIVLLLWGGIDMVVEQLYRIANALEKINGRHDG